MKKTSFLFMLGVLLLILMASFTGYKVWKSSATDVELEKAERTFSEYNQQVLEKANRKVVQAVAAKQVVSNIEKDAVKWSTVIKEIRKALPKKKGEEIIQIVSYTGSSGKDISLNVKTLPESENPYLDVADAIKSFYDSESFDDVFVSSIGGGDDDEGNKILSFLITLKYLGNAGDEAVVSR